MPKSIVDLIGAIRSGLYVGPFRSPLGESGGSHYDLPVGRAFVSLWAENQTGASLEMRRRVTLVEESLAEIFGFAHLTILASFDGNELQVKIADGTYKLNEMGSGFAEALYLLSHVVFRSPSAMFLDEPELRLHPRQQVALVQRIAGLCSGPTWLATHSLGLALSVGDRVLAFNAERGRARATIYHPSEHLGELVGQLTYPGLQLGSGRSVLLVEGAKDIKFFREICRILGCDPWVLIVSLGGSNLIHGKAREELSYLRRVAPNAVCVIDSERSFFGQELDQGRKRFLDDCAAEGIQAHATERRASENYLTGRAIAATIGEKHTDLGSFGRELTWDKSHNWRIAAKLKRDEIEATDVGQFLLRFLAS
jgi:energy-coupling factor transporter ATP-binding protein EcfA2